MTQEELRLNESGAREKHWKRWGPYLSERAWGTVREDYSPYGTAWDYLPRGCFKGWMFRIARNLMIDSTRRRSHDALVNAVRSQRPRDDADDVLARLAGDFVLPDVKADQNEFAKIVGELLEKIPEEQRLTFMMHHYSGLSLPEVADAMEANLPTTKSRLRLAREKLRELLAERGILDPNQPDKSAGA